VASRATNIAVLSFPKQRNNQATFCSRERREIIFNYSLETEELTTPAIKR